MPKDASVLGSCSASLLTTSDALVHVGRQFAWGSASASATRWISLFFSCWPLVFLYTLSQEERVFVCYLLRHRDDNHACLSEDRELVFVFAINEHLSNNP